MKFKHLGNERKGHSLYYVLHSTLYCFFAFLSFAFMKKIKYGQQQPQQILVWFCCCSNKMTGRGKKKGSKRSLLKKDMSREIHSTYVHGSLHVAGRKYIILYSRQLKFHIFLTFLHGHNLVLKQIRKYRQSKRKNWQLRKTKDLLILQ